MRLNTYVFRALLMLTLGLVWSSCAFPSVEYETETSTSCAVPTSCQNDVVACSNKADAAQNMCSMKCSMSCPDCDADFDQALSICVAQCETCSANAGCLNATESCKALFGVP